MFFCYNIIGEYKMTVGWYYNARFRHTFYIEPVHSMVWWLPFLANDQRHKTKLQPRWIDSTTHTNKLIIRINLFILRRINWFNISQHIERIMLLFAILQHKSHSKNSQCIYLPIWIGKCRLSIVPMSRRNTFVGHYSQWMAEWKEVCYMGNINLWNIFFNHFCAISSEQVVWRFSFGSTYCSTCLKSIVPSCLDQRVISTNTFGQTLSF